jgi:hypothetical protein
MELERRGCVVQPRPRANWKREESVGDLLGDAVGDRWNPQRPHPVAILSRSWSRCSTPIPTATVGRGTAHTFLYRRRVLCRGATVTLTFAFS